MMRYLQKCLLKDFDYIFYTFPSSGGEPGRRRRTVTHFRRLQRSIFLSHFPIIFFDAYLECFLRALVWERVFFFFSVVSRSVRQLCVSLYPVHTTVDVKSVKHSVMVVSAGGREGFLV